MNKALEHMLLMIIIWISVWNLTDFIVQMLIPEVPLRMAFYLVLALLAICYHLYAFPDQLENVVSD